MRKLVGSLAAALVIAAIVAGSVAADPINKNSRYFEANCGGDIVTFVTESGASAQILSDDRMFVLKGATEDGAWIIPISNGQSKQDLIVCSYTQLVDGHQFVLYVAMNHD